MKNIILAIICTSFPCFLFGYFMRMRQEKMAREYCERKDAEDLAEYEKAKEKVKSPGYVANGPNGQCFSDEKKKMAHFLGTKTLQ